MIACLCMLSCNGMFGGIYDEVDAASVLKYGFIEQDKDGNGGTIYVDATSYERWSYLDFKNRRMDTANIVHEEKEPSSWDIAIHRYDVKTNGGAAARTDFESLDAVSGATQVQELTFVEDIADSVTVDMSTMMEGYLGRAASNINQALCSWLDVNTSQMPPIYTMSNKVYVVRMADSSLAALLFTNYINESSQKGYITINYKYPLQ